MTRYLLVIFLIIGLGVSVQAQGLTISSYNIDPSPVIPGQVFTLYAYVYNNSGVPVSDAQFTLQLGEDVFDTPHPFAIEPTDSLSKPLGTLVPYQTIQVQYRIRVAPDALDGFYTLTLRASSASNPAGAILPVSIQILARKPIVTIIDSIPSSISLGATASLTLTLRNTGSSPARDILVSLKEDRTVTSGGAVVERDIIPLGASTTYLATLDVGSTASLTIPILVNPSASSKPYFVPVTLEYYDANKTQYSITDYIGLKVTGEPDLGLLFAEANPLLSPGNPSRIVLDIFNKGLGPAKSLTAQVDTNLLELSTTRFFIGTIESDDFDSLTLEGTVSPSLAPGTYPLPITFTFRNEFGDPSTVTETVFIQVYHPSQVPQTNGSSDFFVWLVLLAVAAGIIWWFRFRKSPIKK
ncbi:MAG: hypothetical protein Q8P05_00130 [Candidatus Diapherotrites archaeon]|nr:hypothetical protein [Candidatus Diapherotrites archaeon]MDZ4256152.1 hypothetical protein [archaeon]